VVVRVVLALAVFGYLFVMYAVVERRRHLLALELAAFRRMVAAIQPGAEALGEALRRVGVTAEEFTQAVVRLVRTTDGGENA